MIRAILSLKKLSFDETEGNVSYQYGNARTSPSLSSTASTGCGS